jgi:hypothetical protein
MDAALERYVDHADDPRLIPGIYNSCDRRCQHCPFTGRCLAFRRLKDDELRAPERDVVEHAHDNFMRSLDLLRHWCEREGIDFDQLRDEATSEAATAEHDRKRKEIECDPLHQLAHTYMIAALDLVDSLMRLAPFHEWSPVVREAIDTIGWYAGTVGAKVHRALHGCAERAEADDDPVQNDWNGSAKVARLAIAESQRAWDTLLTAGQAPPGAPLFQTRDVLSQIDAGIAQRFPRAMEFVRPGFDEPAIAAGALATMECLEPRPSSPPRGGVAAWLQRIASRWQRRS